MRYAYGHLAFVVRFYKKSTFISLLVNIKEKHILFSNPIVLEAKKSRSISTKNVKNGKEKNGEASLRKLDLSK